MRRPWPGSPLRRAALALLLGLVACGGGGGLGGPAAPTRGVLLLVDQSGSVLRYRADNQVACSLLVASLPPNTRLVAAPITGSTESSFVPAINDTTPAEGGALSEPLEVEARKRRFQLRSTEGLARLFQAPAPAATTDILSSLALVSRLFPRGDGFQPSLVILSDMVHETRELDMSRGVPEGEALQALVADLKAKGLIPALPGVPVHVIGAASDDPVAYRKVRVFWEAVFHEAGMELRQYGRSPAQFQW